LQAEVAHMNDEEKLAADEARKLRQHEAVKGRVSENVNAEISREADRITPREQDAAGAVASSLKQTAVREVAHTESELSRTRRLARASQVVDYVFYLIYGIIALEIALEALGAREGAGFKQFIDTLASPLLAPFEGLMADPGTGNYRFMLSYVVALIVYVLVHFAVKGLLRLFIQRKTTV
jgi:uncharacterized protein YggT (Ycf19 family)